MFQILKYIHINPLYLFILFIYGATRLIEYITDSSGGTWAKLWNYSSSFLDQNVPLAYIFALPFCIVAIHWILAGAFAARDIVAMRRRQRVVSSRRSRREQRGEIVDLAAWLKWAKTVLINQLIVLPSSMLANYYFLKATDDTECLCFKTVPSFSTMLYKFVLCMIVFEISFFYIHFMLHHPLIYTQDKHRRDYTALENLWQHPLEYVLLNVLPTALAVFLTRSDSVTSTVFMAAIVIAPVFERSALHHESHEGANEINGMMDYLHGTCKNFLQSDNFKNSKILLSMKALTRNKTE